MVSDGRAAGLPPSDPLGGHWDLRRERWPVPRELGVTFLSAQTSPRPRVQRVPGDHFRISDKLQGSGDTPGAARLPSARGPPSWPSAPQSRGWSARGPLCLAPGLLVTQAPPQC